MLRMGESREAITKIEAQLEACQIEDDNLLNVVNVLKLR